MPRTDSKFHAPTFTREDLNVVLAHARHMFDRRDIEVMSFGSNIGIIIGERPSEGFLLFFDERERGFWLQVADDLRTPHITHSVNGIIRSPQDLARISKQLDHHTIDIH